MTIQPIGSASVALYITPADLKEHGLTPAGLTLERALAITQTAFHEAGITLEGSIEIEAYPDACGVLVFAHVRAPERAWFSFDGWSLWWPRPGICPHRGRMRRCSGGRTAGGSRWERGRSRPLRGCRSSAAVRPHAPIWKPGWPSTAAPCGIRTPSPRCSPTFPSDLLTSVV